MLAPPEVRLQTRVPSSAYFWTRKSSLPSPRRPHVAGGVDRPLESRDSYEPSARSVRDSLPPEESEVRIVFPQRRHTERVAVDGPGAVSNHVDAAVQPGHPVGAGSPAARRDVAVREAHPDTGVGRRGKPLSARVELRHGVGGVAAGLPAARGVDVGGPVHRHRRGCIEVLHPAIAKEVGGRDPLGAVRCAPSGAIQGELPDVALDLLAAYRVSGEAVAPAGRVDALARRGDAEERSPVLDRPAPGRRSERQGVLDQETGVGAGLPRRQRLGRIEGPVGDSEARAALVAGAAEEGGRGDGDRLCGRRQGEGRALNI